MIKTYRVEIVIVFILVLAAAGWFGGSYYLAQKHAEVVSMLKEAYPDRDRERLLAEKYWALYPGVEGDPYFGRNGRLDFYGAREHFLRHGRDEGRAWPTLED